MANWVEPYPAKYKRFCISLIAMRTGSVALLISVACALSHSYAVKPARTHQALGERTQTIAERNDTGTLQCQRYECRRIHAGQAYSGPGDPTSRSHWTSPARDSAVSRVRTPDLPHKKAAAKAAIGAVTR